MLVICNDELKTLLTPDVTRTLVATAMQQTSNGGAIQPLRWGMPMPTGGFLGMMPGYLKEPHAAGLKLVNIFADNAARGLSSHVGCMLLFDPDTGQPLAMIDAGELTALRTAAASALATDMLALPDSRTLCVIGAGEQALAHIQALLHVRAFREIRVWLRDQSKASDLQQRISVITDVSCHIYSDIQQAMHQADVVCTLTSSATPLIDASMLAPGMHLNVVGACVIEKQEISNDCLPPSRYYVDSTASAWAQAGELHHAKKAKLIDDNYIQDEIGSVIDNSTFKRDPYDITIYRSLGVAAQDLVVAHYVYNQAQLKQLGQFVQFP